MADPIRRALTRHRTKRGTLVVDEPPNEALVLVVKFGIGMTALLCILEVAHMVIFRSFNSEIFAAITGLSGTITGIFVGQKT